MWHLNYLDSDKEQQYYDLIFPKVEKKRNKSYKKLTDEEIEWLLLAKPAELYAVKDLLKFYFPTCDLFDYKSLISNDKETAYKIAKLIGVNTCVYCNRQYIFTVEKNKKHITRPEFDHYLPKSEYPFFALSLYNLIPSCHICNSNCKGTIELDKDMNPYLTEKQDYFKFTYHIKENGMPSAVKIKDRKNLNADVENFLDTFKIEEIYDAHTNLELADLYTFATKYSNTYLQEVLNKTKLDLQSSQEEAYRILFGTELFEDKDNNRPLSKFKRDILRELRVIQ